MVRWKEMAMSEDRLERALQEMKQENVDSGTLEAARARVWQKVANADHRVTIDQ